MRATAVFIGPEVHPDVAKAVMAGGGSVVDSSAAAAAIVWLATDPSRIVEHLGDQVGWVQLPQAGVERWLGTGVVDDRRIWTSAAGAYGPIVAERAVALLLAGVHRLQEHARARAWSRLATGSLQGCRVLIAGTGAVGRSIARGIQPFDAVAIGMNRTGALVPGFDPVYGFDDWPGVCTDVDHVVLALPDTALTHAMVDSDALATLPDHAVLVNVGRGGLVDSEALSSALHEGHIGAACLDVTSPEPLPADHALWHEPRALVTSHTANPRPGRTALLATHVRHNVQRWIAGEPLLSVIDVERGY